jgi:3-keto-disaccharide hydrolase
MTGRTRVALLVGLLLALVIPAPAAAAADDDGFTRLFDGQTFTNFYRFTNDEAMFKIEQGLLHVFDLPESTQAHDFGYIATDREYANYHFRVRYRWGQKRFAPRAFDKRDAGILYHVVGPDLIWPRSVECQIQEGDTGDIFLVSGTGASTTIDPTVATPERQYLEAGTPYSQVDGRIVKGNTVDSLTDWNDVEIIVTGSEAAHIVNGVVVARVSDMTRPDPADPNRRIPLDRGRILLQAEGAELYYDRIEINELADLGRAPPADAEMLFDSASICPGCGDLRSTNEFEDFRLHVEFNVPSTSPNLEEQERGNSGIYLQGRYEVQVLDSFGASVADQNDAAAIYALKDADVNAARPSGTWQSYDITFRAARWSNGAKVENARVSVNWNGVPVQSDVELPGPTPGGSAESTAPGPIVLQEHGNSVRYRNVWLSPLR